MPTFRSIGLHPDLRIETDGASVDTPQGLLARTALYDDRGRPLPEARRLKRDVAEALLGRNEAGIPGCKTVWELVQQSRTLEPIRLGCPSIDELWAVPEPSIELYTTESIPSGLSPGYITRLVGPSSLGKTQLALHLLSRSSNGHFLSNGPVRPRLAQLGASLATVHCVRDEFELLRAVATIAEMPPSLVVVDLWSTSSLLETPLRRLARLGFVVLVLGVNLKSDVEVLVEKRDDGIRLTLTKHPVRACPVESSARYRIGSQGFEEIDR